MKALSLHQPWASLISSGLKNVETRHWGTKYRGDLLICSGKKKDKNYQIFYETHFQERLAKLLVCNKSLLSYEKLPFGSAVCIVNLADCLVMTEELIKQQNRMELFCGHWEVGRIAWVFKNIRPVNFPVIGKQGLFEVDF